MAVATQQIKSKEFLPSIAHLLPGGTLTFHYVPWAEYEDLLEDLGARYNARISYDNGKLEIMMPLPIHEKHERYISRLMQVMTDELGIGFEDLGSTTFKYKDWLQGLEPDTCFYVKTAAKVIGVERFDPDVPPPPPDIAVEIDITSESLSRFHIYARLGVPEIWHYDQHRVQIYHLVGSDYVEAAASRIFPFLTGEVLFQFLERSKREGQSETLREFRDWVRLQQA